MDATPRGYPYPECDPPLTKDVSDIAHLRDLATAVDTDVQNVYDTAASTVVLPDAARMGMTVSVPGTASGSVFPFFNSRTFDTSGTNELTPVSEGFIRLRRVGFYQVGCYAEFTSATLVAARCCFLLNGRRITSFPQFADIGASNVQSAHHAAEVYNPAPGGALTIEVRLGAPAAYTYTARLWVNQVISV